MNKFLDSFSHRQIYLFAILTSLLISVLIGYRHSIINPDGICYLLSAQMLDSISLREVMHYCPQSKWPFYSSLIYGLVNISHISYDLSAHILNGLFTLVSVVMFIKIVEALGGNQRVMWLAALVILFSHQLNVLRDDIIRDHGFWACYLTSIYLLIRYFRQPKLMTALLWNASLIFATLFRIEGAIFLFALPFLAWLVPQQSFIVRAKAFFSLNAVFMLVCLALLMWQLFHPDQSMQQWGRVNEVIHQFQNGFDMIVNRFDVVKANLLQHVLPEDSRPDANAVMFLVLICWYLYNVVLTLGFGYTIFVLVAFATRSAVFNKQNAMVIWGYILINLLMTLAFMAETLFVSKRYLVALTLVLCLWIPFAINHLIDKWADRRHRVFLSLMAIVFFISALSGVVDFGRSKSYIRTAGHWMSSEVPAEAKLYINDLQLMYYSNHFGNRLFEVLPSYVDLATMTNGKWKEYDYIALRLRKNDNSKISPLLKELQDFTPMKIFSDKQGNRIAIYRISHQKNNS